MTRQGKIKLCDLGVSGELINSLAQTFTGTQYYMAVTYSFILHTSGLMSILSQNVFKERAILFDLTFGL